MRINILLFACLMFMSCEKKEEKGEKQGGNLPKAQFTIAITDGATVAVDNQSASSGKTTYHWDYGDNRGGSTLKSPPAYSYVVSGNYAITLTVSNETGSDVANQPVSIVLLDPVADFTFEQDAYRIIFTNTSRHARSYLWDFGDGNTSVQMSPSHIYSRLGSYSVSLTATNAEGTNAQKTADITMLYSNPVLTTSVPDPTIIRHSNGNFYLYATEDIGNVPIFRSADLVTWEFVGTAFTGATRPTFEPGGGIWAPDINFVNGQYVLYYSMSVWGGGSTCGIGRATAADPEGPFTDLGVLFRSNVIGVNNSIDPFYIEDEGKKYLFWGSWYGIWGIELSDDGLSLKGGASSKRQIAGTAYEASYIHKRGNYYYLFASIGSCCEGTNSTYTTVVGRSDNLWGPYTNKRGQSMMSNHHEIVIQKNASFVGTGHNSEIVQDDNGDDWILYHGWRVSDGAGRLLFLDKIVWENDWPSVKGGSPSIIAESPVFDLFSASHPTEK
jgi:arabinan endo-1,5-alpha-L-arabinosidase